jgi:chromosome segregation protein
MRVTRLEVFGFKSFVERFVLNFDKNLLGIVGPNGCGKSNIVDALRWVLGETHARQLRGNTLDDLIFNGCESRKPLGMAEVSLTIRPDEGWAQRTTQNLSAGVIVESDSVADQSIDPPGNGSNTSAFAASDVEQAIEQVLPSSLFDIPGIFETAEIQLTRRLYRSGESEYFINRVPCRLRDMLDIYRLIGLGSRGLSIVQQGQIGEFISKKPIERRELLEEAAGISGFRNRIEAAQRKLERTSANMARLGDIIIEVEKQTRILKRQASQARARNELKASLVEAELGLFKVRSAKILRRKKEQETVHCELADKVSVEENALLVVEAKQEELRLWLTERDTEITALRLRRDELFQTMSREREKVQEWQIELTRVEGRERSLAAELRRLAQRQEQHGTEIRELSGQIESKKSLAGRLSKEKENAEQALEAIQKQEQLCAFNQEAAEGSSDYALRAREIKQLSEDVEGLPVISSAVEEAQRGVAALRVDLQGRKDGIYGKRLALARLEAEIRSLEGQLSALAEHIAANTGPLAEESKQALSVLSESPGRVLASAISVPEYLQKAVVAVLGERGNYLVSNKALDLARHYAGRASYGTGKNAADGVRIGVIEQDPGRAFPERGVLSEELEAAPCARRLVELLGIDQGYEASLEVLLGGVLYVDELAQAVELNSRNRQAGRPLRMMVTRSGEVVTPWGWYTTAGEGIGYSVRRRIEELARDAELANAEIVSLEGGVAELETKLFVEERVLTERSSTKETLISQQKRLAVLLREQQEEERRRREHVLEQERSMRQSAMAKERGAQGDIQRLGADLARLRGTVEYEEGRVSSLRAEIERLGEEAGRLAAEQQKIESEKERLSAALVAITMQNSSGARKEVEQEFAAIDSGIKEHEKKRTELNEELGQVSRRTGELRKNVSALHEERNSAQLILEKAELELGMLHEDLLRQGAEVALPDEGEVAALIVECTGDLESRISGLQDDVFRLRRRLEREGEVDPTSIQRYEEEHLRLEQMKMQHVDLQAASKTLDKTIRQLKEISRARFMATYQDVSKKFAELVPRLFGGGAGHMELVNPEDPLGSGVEITVRPPGKRISSMDLLSGGEKALVAASVIIAMFLHRPSPICVLDEVDAPLDDANLDRFTSLIQEIADKTQFLIITHNKATMAAVDRLIGITMEERGVSKALSITFAEAEEQIEQWAANA